MTGATVHIRRARKVDAALLVHFNRALAQETEDKVLPHERVMTGVRAALADPAKGFYLIAGVDGAAAGGLLVTFEWSDWRNANFWWIQSVYVEPEFRKRGVYTALYRHVEDEARASGDVCGIRLYVDEENKRAQTVYHQLGMHRSRYFMYESEEITPGFRNDAEG